MRGGTERRGAVRGGSARSGAGRCAPGNGWGSPAGGPFFLSSGSNLARVLLAVVHEMHEGEVEEEGANMIKGKSWVGSRSLVGFCAAG